jgi:hypothetical protein
MHRFDPRQRFALFRRLHTRFFTRFRFRVQRLRYGGRPPHIANHEHIDFKIARGVLDMHTVAGMNFA